MPALNVAVVVAGELARSPRMINHARELARAGCEVSLIGYGGREFAAPEGVRVQALRTRGATGARWSLARAGLRTAGMLPQLLAALWRARPAAILVQNPPSFPSLAAAWIAARLLRAQLVIDWHNYGYSMLALRPGAGGAASGLAARYEGWMGRRAGRHFCVSEGMRQDLARRFGVRAEVLYDRPVEPIASRSSSRGGRLVAVCPAGWTADEAMDLLLDSLESLGERGLELHLTGDGPARRELAPRIAALGSSGLSIHTGFLSQADYWALIGRADLGLSLHRSSSGLDLAMKVVDLFSAGVPVCALDYGAVLREQVQPGETGFLFGSARRLAEILDALQRDPAPLAAMRGRIRERWSVTWSEEWRRVAGPVFGGTA